MNGSEGQDTQKIWTIAGPSPELSSPATDYIGTKPVPARGNFPFHTAGRQAARSLASFPPCHRTTDKMAVS